MTPTEATPALPDAARVEAIRARVEAATAGPWEVTRHGGDPQHIVGYTGDTKSGFVAQTLHGNDLANALLIAHAPADLAWLLARVGEADAARWREEARVNHNLACMEQGRADAAETRVTALERDLRASLTDGTMMRAIRDAWATALRGDVDETQLREMLTEAVQRDFAGFRRAEATPTLPPTGVKP